MKIRLVKTPLHQRKTYTYRFADGSACVVKVGESGVTDEIIKKLHALDDADVYNNLKNTTVLPTKAEEKELRAWNKAHPESPRQLKWHIRLNATIQIDGESASTVIENIACEEEPLNPAVVKMRNIVSNMTPKQQRVYELLYIENFKKYEVAAIMGVSTARITALKKRIIEILKENLQRG